MNPLVCFLSLVFLMASASRIEKRGTAPGFGFSGFGGGFNFVPQDVHINIPSSGPWVSAPVYSAPPPQLIHAPPSPQEIATVIAAAKDASANVQLAQQRVQQAKQEVIETQKFASAREAQANLALKQSEAAAAVQRQAASAAANAVVHAQQKLAEAKAEVADKQRIAAAKESLAALIIGKSASAAAAEIQRSEHTANKIAALQRSEAQAAIQHVSAAKENTLAATAAAVSAASNAQPPFHGPSGPSGPYGPPSGPFGKKLFIPDYPWS